MDVRLRPGNHTIESDEPLVFQGRSDQWRQTVDSVGRDASVNMTAANAVTAETSQSETLAPGQASPSELLMEWQANVVNLWSATARGAGFVLDRRGLILTNERVVGSSTSVEVQFTATTKVQGHVLVRDREKNVAVIWIYPLLVAAIPPAKLGYTEDGESDLKEGQDVFAVDASVLDQKTLLSGRLTRADTRVIASDIRFDISSSGVPILAANGDIIAITTVDSRGRERP